MDTDRTLAIREPLPRVATPGPGREPRRRRRNAPAVRRGIARFRSRVAAAVVVSLLVLTGCSVRLETPPPEPPEPGPLEITRQATAVASAEIAELASTASLDTLDERRFALLERIRLDAEAHVEALGGVYSDDEGGVIDTDTLTEDDAADDGASEETPEPVNLADLVVKLVNHAVTARGAADQVEDQGLGRLLAVIGTSRLLAADSLARHLDLDRPVLGGENQPTILPSGPGAADLTAIVVAEDHAAFAFEMIAARSTEGERRRALAASQRHRATSDTWARLAGMTEPGLDPRSVSYALDGALADADARADLAARVEWALVENYASLIALTARGERAGLSELHTLATESARRWGQPPGALPGLLE